MRFAQSLGRSREDEKQEEENCRDYLLFMVEGDITDCFSSITNERTHVRTYSYVCVFVHYFHISGNPRKDVTNATQIAC